MITRNLNSPNIISNCLVYTGGKHSLIWPRGVCAAEQGIVFRVFSLKTWYTISLFSVLNRVSFSHRKPLKQCEVDGEGSLYVVPTIFFPRKVLACLERIPDTILFHARLVTCKSATK